CSRRDSDEIGIFLNSDRSQLLTPGPRITSFGALPNVPLAGRANASVLKKRVKARSPLDTMGLDSTTARTPSPPPAMSAPSVVDRPIPSGTPLWKMVIPESCQRSRIAFATGLPIREPGLGKSQVYESARL